MRQALVASWCRCRTRQLGPPVCWLPKSLCFVFLYMICALSRVGVKSCCIRYDEYVVEMSIGGGRDVDWRRLGIPSYAS